MPTSASSSSLHVTNPNFDIDESDNEIELWSFRLPVNFPTSKLNGIEIDISQLVDGDESPRNEKKNGGKKKLSATTKNTAPTSVAEISTAKGTFILAPNKTEGLDTFRALIPVDSKKGNKNKNQKNDHGDNVFEQRNDTQDESSKGGGQGGSSTSTKGEQYLHPTTRPFTKHFDVISEFERLTERQLAPLNGPQPVDKQIHAYAHVPQRTGLVRRWMPPGVPSPKKERVPPRRMQGASPPTASTPTPPSPKPITKTASEPPPTSSTKKRRRQEAAAEDGEDAPGSSDRKISKAEKRARKEEKKKLKKERKSLKKDKKSPKKSKA